MLRNYGESRSAVVTGVCARLCGYQPPQAFHHQNSFRCPRFLPLPRPRLHPEYKPKTPTVSASLLICGGEYAFLVFMTSTPYACSYRPLYDPQHRGETSTRQYQQSMILWTTFPLHLGLENHTNVLVLNKIAVPFRSIYRETEEQCTQRSQDHDDDA